MTAPLRVSLNALRAFEATARLRSFSAAAEELSVTHGAVSQPDGHLLRELSEVFGGEPFVGGFEQGVFFVTEVALEDPVELHHRVGGSQAARRATANHCA